MSGKILITTRSFRKLDGKHKQILRDARYELVDSPYERPLTGDELAELIVDMDGAILGVDEVSAKVFERGNKLKVISRYGVGYDKVDVVSATAHGIPVTITPGANSIAVAELTLGLMLAVARHIPKQAEQVKNGNFSPITGMELDGATLGLIGLGRIGQEVAKRAYAFGMSILFYDPFPPADEFLAQYACQDCTLSELLKNSDVISLHSPHTPETHHLIDSNALNQMKSTAILINTARGGLVDEESLYHALKNGVIAGAGFDVFSDEPPTDSPLLMLDNFVGTPHSGSATLQTTLKMGLMASENALTVLRGGRSPHTINPEVYDR